MHQTAFQHPAAASRIVFIRSRMERHFKGTAGSEAARLSAET